MKKNCFLCKRIFDCEQNTDTCWCKDIMIEKDVLNSISMEGTDCLCKICLSQISSNKIEEKSR